MKRGILLLAAATWFVLAGCRGGSQEDRRREIQAERQRYEVAIQSRLDSLDVRILQLKRDVTAQGARVSGDLQESLDTLERQRDELADRLSRLQKAGEVSWDNMRREVDRDLQELQRSYDRIRSQL